MRKERGSSLLRSAGWRLIPTTFSAIAGPRKVSSSASEGSLSCHSASCSGDQELKRASSPTSTPSALAAASPSTISSWAAGSTARPRTIRATSKSVPHRPSSDAVRLMNLPLSGNRARPESSDAPRTPGMARICSVCSSVSDGSVTMASSRRDSLMKRSAAVRVRSAPSSSPVARPPAAPASRAITSIEPTRFRRRDFTTRFAAAIRSILRFSGLIIEGGALTAGRVPAPSPGRGALEEGDDLGGQCGRTGRRGGQHQVGRQRRLVGVVDAGEVRSARRRGPSRRGPSGRAARTPRSACRRTPRRSGGRPPRGGSRTRSRSVAVRADERDDRDHPRRRRTGGRPRRPGGRSRPGRPGRSRGRRSARERRLSPSSM